ncbi:hypothetical protein Pcinc_010314 [Petrolisthes cinctipes]|uniref:Death domain-containing protein n=1 Tax=Petrolisthes cinctipes TaxID=88211 RepID=A0AAE1G323_PETCI|nr:hypothetical protein Pcinc_010314 [Petrolisthes cinctipes]
MAHKHTPERKMRPENLKAKQAMEEEIARLEEEEQCNRKYEWFDDAVEISVWKYFDINYDIIMDFATREDLERWDLLADKLGLSGIYIDHCKKYNRLYPTIEVFRALFMMKDKAQMSLREVLDALKDLNQHNILRAIPWEKGIEKVMASNKLGSNSEVCKPNEKSDIVKFDKGQFSLNITEQPSVLVRGENQGTVNEEIPVNPKPSQPCQGLVIMLIFAQDSRDDAQRVARQLRSPESERGVVQVLQLTGDITNAVAINLRTDPFNCIHKWFKQVRFIVPVLSPQLLAQTQNHDVGKKESKDHIYNRFVYRMMQDQYVNNGSRNTRCRAVCPDVHHKQVMSNMLVRGNGLFQLHWKCSSSEQVEEFAKILWSEYNFS